MTPSPTPGSPRDDKAEVARFLDQIRETADKLAYDQIDRGDAKLLARSLRELRFAFRTLARYRDIRKITVFGSARTPPSTPSYGHARAFGHAMAEQHWIVVTGAGSGIMEAAHQGAGSERSFGVNIKLPFEQSANPVVAKSERIVHLNYFFTRKLVFVKESDGIALFPGGFGTLDEGFEVLTLLQTGKANPIPIVLVDEPGGRYWEEWRRYVVDHLLGPGLISPEDLHLFKVTSSIEEAVEEMTSFYRNYDSMRYIRNRLAIRVREPIGDGLFERIRSEFQDILQHGDFERGDAHAHEATETRLVGLPRLYFPFNRRSFGRLRLLIDVLNGRA